VRFLLLSETMHCLCLALPLLVSGGRRKRFVRQKKHLQRPSQSGRSWLQKDESQRPPTHKNKDIDALQPQNFAKA
jgi:hypothetical protein